jgi:glucan-binding YG repeat protein
MNFIKRLFQQKTITLGNGQKVKKDDKVYYIDSDGVKRTGKIERRKNGTLYFHNSNFEVTDYFSLALNSD